MEINNHDKLYLLSLFDRVSIIFHKRSGGLGLGVWDWGLETVVWKLGVDGVVGV